MQEIEKYSPMPPQLGPPLPSILKAYWPWVKSPPPPPSPEPKLPQATPPRNPFISYVDVNDSLLKASIEGYRAEQAAKGLVPFVYE